MPYGWNRFSKIRQGQSTRGKLRIENIVGFLILGLTDTVLPFCSRELESPDADKGYDSEHIREQITKKGARAVIPRKCNSIKDNADMDRGLYKYRHMVENAFARLK